MVLSQDSPEAKHGCDFHSSNVPTWAQNEAMLALLRCPVIEMPNCRVHCLGYFLIALLVETLETFFKFHQSTAAHHQAWASPASDKAWMISCGSKTGTLVGTGWRSSEASDGRRSFAGNSPDCNLGPGWSTKYNIQPSYEVWSGSSQVELNIIGSELEPVQRMKPPMQVSLLIRGVNPIGSKWTETL